MRRRIYLMGAALSVALLVMAGSAFAAAKKGKSKAPAGKAIACATKTAVTIANGDNQVLPPASSGTEYGTAVCGGAFGRGVQRDSFTVPASGDTNAKYTLYFPTGTIHGTYDLTPQEGTLNFLETDWTGTLKVLGGTGAFKGAAGKGIMVCKSMDGVHTVCADKLLLTK